MHRRARAIKATHAARASMTAARSLAGGQIRDPAPSTAVARPSTRISIEHGYCAPCWDGSREPPPLSAFVSRRPQWPYVSAFQKGSSMRFASGMLGNGPDHLPSLPSRVGGFFGVPCHLCHPCQDQPSHPALAHRLRFTSCLKIDVSCFNCAPHLGQNLGVQLKSLRPV